jgi:hypothetical protein
MESLFLAYNDECDAARVNCVRKQLLATGRYLAEGYMPFTTWSKTKLGCSSEEIQRTIEKGLEHASAALILIGPDAAANPWIRYVIERSYASKKPMLGLFINDLPDERGKSAQADLNPLERFAVLERGKKIYLSDRYRTYTWSDPADGQFDMWLELAKHECLDEKPASQVKMPCASKGSAADSAHTTTARELDSLNL